MTHPVRARLLVFGVAAVLAACGGGAKAVTPTQLVSGAATYDGESVSVSGTAKDPKQRQTRRGALVRYQLCDSACVNVVQFGSANVTDGATVSVTGTFHASFGRMRRIDNVVIVGGRRPSS